MQRLSELQVRLQSLGELNGVVRALRSISAARVQQAHVVLDSIRQYTTVIQDALTDAAQSLPLPQDPSAAGDRAGSVVVFGSEHGFVGGFNERLLDVAALEQRPGDELLVVGARSVLLAGERRAHVSWSCAMASQVGGIDDVALRVAEELARAEGQRAAERVILVYTRSSAGTWRIVTETLLPFDLRPYTSRRGNRAAPISNLSRGTLLNGLVVELLFAELAHAAAESFASENAARLAAMESAADNVAGKLDELRRIERELRQEEITTELMEVVTGVEAITNRT